MASAGAKRSRCLKRLAGVLEWGHTGDSSGCASTAHNALVPASLSVGKQQESTQKAPASESRARY